MGLDRTLPGTTVRMQIAASQARLANPGCYPAAALTRARARFAKERPDRARRRRHRTPCAASRRRPRRCQLRSATPRRTRILPSPTECASRTRTCPIIEYRADAVRSARKRERRLHAAPRLYVARVCMRPCYRAPRDGVRSSNCMTAIDPAAALSCERPFIRLTTRMQAGAGRARPAGLQGSNFAFSFLRDQCFGTRPRQSRLWRHRNRPGARARPADKALPRTPNPHDWTCGNRRSWADCRCDPEKRKLSVTISAIRHCETPGDELCPRVT
jgi:hypothetical protein